MRLIGARCSLWDSPSAVFLVSLLTPGIQVLKLAHLVSKLTVLHTGLCRLRHQKRSWWG